MGEAVDALFDVVGELVGDAVDDAGGAAGRGDVAGLEDVERKGVVGLVAGPVGNGGAGGQPEGGGDGGRHGGLQAEGGRERGEEGGVDAPVLEEEGGGGVFGEVPEGALGEAGGGGEGFAGEAKGEVVAREHDFVDTGEISGLVFLDPAELGGGEVAGRVEEAAEAGLGAEVGEGFGADGDGAAVAPDDGGADDVVVGVNGHEAVHLVGDADGAHLGGVGFGEDGADCLGGVLPPDGRVLLGPAGLGGVDRHLFGGGLRGGDDASGGGVEEGGFDGGAAEIETEEEHGVG